MKAKLIKRDDGYNLVIEQPQGRLLEATCSPSQQLILDKSGASTKHKLSKQNCDEIFGIVDVEKLADEYALTIKDKDQHTDARFDFIEGFNKAMELNRFTLSQLKTAMDMARVMIDGKYAHSGEYIYNFIQQPTEIDVVIVMDTDCTGEFKYFLLDKGKPKLDENGCLILKRK
jgi:hypothetical protein